MKIFIWGTGDVATRYFLSGELNTEDVLGFILMWQKTPCLYRREMNATSTEFTQVIEVDNRT